jgi:predicted transposase YbfD/YdcC
LAVAQQHRQGETARVVTQRGGDWLFTLKANRHAQHKEVATWFADPHSRPKAEHVTTDRDHGRIEVRRHVVSHCVDWMRSDRRHPDEASLPGLGMIGMVEATVTRDGRTSTQRRYYLSSARMHAVQFAAAVRAHWRIENSLHWVLDVTMDEDQARNRRDHGPENLALLRRFALNLLRTNPDKVSIRLKIKRAGWRDDFLLRVLGQMR